eukprot:gene5212-10431_t
MMSKHCMRIDLTYVKYLELSVDWMKIFTSSKYFAYLDTIRMRLFGHHSEFDINYETGVLDDYYAFASFIINENLNDENLYSYVPLYELLPSDFHQCQGQIAPKPKLQPDAKKSPKDDKEDNKSPKLVAKGKISPPSPMPTSKPLATKNGIASSISTFFPKLTSASTTTITAATAILSNFTIEDTFNSSCINGTRARASLTYKTLNMIITTVSDHICTEGRGIYNIHTKSCEDTDISDFGDVLGALLRLSFHDAVTYNPWNITGGPDGCIDFNDTSNAGLKNIWHSKIHNMSTKFTLDEIYTIYSNLLSKADFIALLGNIAVYHAHGPDIYGRDDAVCTCVGIACQTTTPTTATHTISPSSPTTSITTTITEGTAPVSVAEVAEVAVDISHPCIEFHWGRIDSNNCSIEDIDTFPSAMKGHSHIFDIFQTRLNFTNIEIVTLMGAHSIGRVHLNVSGFGFTNHEENTPVPNGFGPVSDAPGSWDNTPHIFDNTYFSSILFLKWKYNFHKINTKSPSWSTTNTRVMLNSDMALVWDLNISPNNKHLPKCKATFLGEDTSSSHINSTSTSMKDIQHLFTECDPSPFLASVLKFITPSGEKLWLVEWIIAFTKMQELGSTTTNSALVLHHESLSTIRDIPRGIPDRYQIFDFVKINTTNGKEHLKTIQRTRPAQFHRAFLLTSTSPYISLNSEISSRPQNTSNTLLTTFRKFVSPENLELPIFIHGATRNYNNHQLDDFLLIFKESPAVSSITDNIYQIDTSPQPKRRNIHFFNTEIHHESSNFTHKWDQTNLPDLRWPCPHTIQIHHNSPMPIGAPPITAFTSSSMDTSPAITANTSRSYENTSSQKSLSPNKINSTIHTTPFAPHRTTCKSPIITEQELLHNWAYRRRSSGDNRSHNPSRQRSYCHSQNKLSMINSKP